MSEAVARAPSAVAATLLALGTATLAAPALWRDGRPARRAGPGDHGLDGSAGPARRGRHAPGLPRHLDPAGVRPGAGRGRGAAVAGLAAGVLARARALGPGQGNRVRGGAGGGDGRPGPGVGPRPSGRSAGWRWGVRRRRLGAGGSPGAGLAGPGAAPPSRGPGVLDLAPRRPPRRTARALRQRPLVAIRPRPARPDPPLDPPGPGRGARSLARAVRRRDDPAAGDGAGAGDRLLWAWAVGPIALLSLATVKNAHYIIHALPPGRSGRP